MVIERTGFFLMAGVLAAGGAAGWMAHDSGIGQQRRGVAVVTPAPTPPAVAQAEPSSVVVVNLGAPEPDCDDSIGAAGDCPSVGPADEGLCGNRLAKRCADFKESFKPRVAQEAVACLNQLKPGERCDPARINLCGHAALMAACPQVPEPAKGSYVNATTTSPASFTVDHSLVAPSALSIACQSMQGSCAGRPLCPSLADCVQTLTGMNDQGRVRTLECVANHCEDRGLLGCEAAPTDPTSLTPPGAAARR
jgi:hypothetical protein